MANVRGNNPQQLQKHKSIHNLNEPIADNIPNAKPDSEKSLKGTLFSVGVVAAVIVGMWITVFWLYMERV